MNNYKLLDPKGEVCFSNISLIRPITGTKEEAGFFLTHVVINADSKRLIEVVEGILTACRENNQQEAKDLFD